MIQESDGSCAEGVLRLGDGWLGEGHPADNRAWQWLDRNSILCP